jgi:hypothetical protein
MIVCWLMTQVCFVLRYFLLTTKSRYTCRSYRLAKLLSDIISSSWYTAATFAVGSRLKQRVERGLRTVRGWRVARSARVARSRREVSARR